MLSCRPSVLAILSNRQQGSSILSSTARRSFYGATVCPVANVLKYPKSTPGFQGKWSRATGYLIGPNGRLNAPAKKTINFNRGEHANKPRWCPRYRLFSSSSYLCASSSKQLVLDPDADICTETLNETEQRPLSKQDQYYFVNQGFLGTGILLFPLKSWKCWLGVTHSDSKLKLAFQCVVQNHPLLQTKIVGDGDEAVYRKITELDSDELPSLFIEPKVQESTEALKERARAILAEQKAIVASRGQDAFRHPMKVIAVRSPDDIAFSFVTYHHFLDGSSTGFFFARLYETQLLPKIAWRWMEPFYHRTLPPTFNEMAFKRKLPDAMDSYEEIDVLDKTCLCPKYAEENFRFENYDPYAPDAKSQLRGMKGQVSLVPSKNVRRIIAALKKDRVTLTTTIDALAVKILARLILLNEEKSQGTEEQCTIMHGPLVISTPVDARRLPLVSPNKGIEHNDKNQQGNKRMKFPVVGNFAFPHFTQVPFEDAVSSSLEKIAKQIKEESNRLKTDETYRLHHIAAAASHAPGDIGYRCFSTFLSIPAVLHKAGIDVRSEHTEADLKAIPVCYLCHVSTGSNSTIHANKKTS